VILLFAFGTATEMVLPTPAIMTLMGHRAWWMPNWLGRLVPRISIEGEGFFARPRC
jgi:RND superfamily putative drug exporter